MEILDYKDKHEYTNKHGITSVVYLMDCMDLLKQIPEKYFELAIVDPPYGIGANKMTLGNGRKKINRGQSNWDSNIPNKEYFALLKNATTNQIIWGATI